MSKNIVPLTVARIRRVKTSPKTQKLYDGGGLVLVIRANSRKMRWVFESRSGGKSISRTLGEYPAFSLAEARKWREELRERLAKGLPLEEETADRFLFEAVYRQWFERWAPEKKSGKYVAQVAAAIERNILPVFRGRDIRTIRPFDVAEALRPMEKRGVLEYLRRVKSSLKLLFGYAVASGLIDFNPVMAVDGHAFRKAKKGHFRALEPSAIPTLTSALESESVGILARLAAYWQLLTMTRPAETAGARWADIDLAARRWTIPAEMMKRGKVHIVPLSDAAVALLKEIRAVNVNGVYLFESRDYSGHMNATTVNVALKRAGAGTTAHGLRALAATYLEEQGYEQRVIDAALSHVKGGGDKTLAAYLRSTLFEQRAELMQALGEWVARHRKESGKIDVP